MPSSKSSKSDYLEGLLARLNKFRQEPRIHIENITVAVNVITAAGGNILNKDDHSINYGARTGDVIVKGNMEHSLNTINNLSAAAGKSDLAAHLKDLHAIINKLIPELTNEDAETVSRDLKTFADEVTSSRPRKSIFEVTATGLLDAAKTVASMTEPVTKAVKAVVELCSKS
jgi:hypothetical protein